MMRDSDESYPEDTSDDLENQDVQDAYDDDASDDEFFEDSPRKRSYRPRRRKIIPFLEKLVQLIQEEPELIQWTAEGSIVIPDPAALERKLPVYFRHQHYSSFQRQLNNFGFNKQNKSASPLNSVYVRIKGEQLCDLDVAELLHLRPVLERSTIRRTKRSRRKAAAPSSKTVTPTRASLRRARSPAPSPAFSPVTPSKAPRPHDRPPGLRRRSPPVPPLGENPALSPRRDPFPSAFAAGPPDDWPPADGGAFGLPFGAPVKVEEPGTPETWEPAPAPPAPLDAAFAAELADARYRDSPLLADPVNFAPLAPAPPSPAHDYPVLMEDAGLFPDDYSDLFAPLPEHTVLF